MAPPQVAPPQVAPQMALPSGERGADPSVTVYGTIVVGVSAVVLLGALFGAWLAIRSGTRVWPPKGVRIQDYFGTTLSVTVLIGALAGWWALYAVRRNERRQAAMSLTLTIFMQGAFINLLTYVVRGSHLSPRTDAYGVLYYALNTAVVAVFASGMAVAAVTLARVLGGQVTSAEPALGWSSAWYGTFVAATWFVMYTIVYVVH